jgi:glycosyltransferase involved in cell wall biosynthesis
VVNQYQCLEMLKRPDLTLYHRDVKFFRESWTPVVGSMTPEHEAALKAMPLPPPGLKADALLRMGFPHYFDASPEAARTFVWVTSEFKRVHPSQIGSGKKPWEELSKSQATVIACSNWAAQGFLNSGLPKSKCVVVPCGVDTSVFHPLAAEQRTELRKSLGWEGTFVALNISGATNNKGIDLIMRAMGELVPKYPELRLSLKGSDSLYMSSDYVRGNFGTLSKTTRELLKDRMFYQGGVLSASDMAKLYQAADVYLSPYRAEGFNLPVLEAAACGLPVICTRGGSTDDFVDDSWALRIGGKESNMGELGWQIEPNFPELVKQFERVITDAPWRASAAAAGPQWVNDKFTWKHSVDKLLKVMLP